MDLCLRGGRVLDPRRSFDAEADVLLTGGVVAEVAPGLAAGVPESTRVVDVRGSWVVPGLIDLHTHLREPGQEYKEDIATGTRAAAAGGFTAVCAMPNTVPPNDTRAVTELILKRAAAGGAVRVYPVGAISKGLKGESLAEIGELREAGCVAISDDGRPVMNAELMRRALEYARTFDLPLVQHCEDSHALRRRLDERGAGRDARRHQRAARRGRVVDGGARHRARRADRRALPRRPRQQRRVGAPGPRGQAARLPVTCEVTPHHLSLTDDACAHYDTAAKCNPPLRGAADVDALREGLRDGTIDAIATDHAPHSSVEKDVEFEQAAFGIIGLETALPLALDLVRAGVLTPDAFVTRLSTAPARSSACRAAASSKASRPT